MIYRLIAPDWLLTETPNLKKVIEGKLPYSKLQTYNEAGYNAYFFPNYPKDYTSGNVEGKDVDIFNWVFVDMDLKQGTYKTKEDFLLIIATTGLLPSKIVDSGNGIHVYWQVSDLNAKSYVYLQRRLARFFNTDLAVGKICQLMRLEGTINTKDANNPKLCQTQATNTISYTCEELDKLLPSITLEDEKYCQNHYNQTYGLSEELPITGELPPKFGKLIHESPEVAQLFSGPTDDRSKNDYRLGHIMLGNGFTKEEALNVLFNSAKAMKRAPTHRYSYAANIVDKIWTYEATENKKAVNMSPTVREILSKGEETIKGTRFPCHKLIDDTEHGFRLGQVIGIVGGSGVGKTTLTLNMFLWFSANNPDYHHFFVSLEQPAGELANRIRTISGGDNTLYDRIHIISNYNDDGTYNNFSMLSIEEHIKKYQQDTGTKVGTLVIDHIGVLNKQTKHGESEGLIGICKEMKAVAVRTNTMLIMLSQAPREKSGVGDLELNKDAAFGTVFFESFVDYLICLWQPLKRVYAEGAPTIMALKFGKIRHKRQAKDIIQEDVRYQFFFDPQTEKLRELTQIEEKSTAFYMNRALNERKKDRKTDLLTYVSRRLDESQADNNQKS